MGIIVTFMLLATLTPFMFISVHKRALAVVQTIALIGMWVYYFEAIFQTAPHAFTISWTAFYASMVLAEIAWIMFSIHVIKRYESRKTVTSH